jgi:hypothetical protein
LVITIRNSLLVASVLGHLGKMHYLLCFVSDCCN